MPRYFFDVQNGESRRDEVGAEFMDDQAAWKEAVRTMRGAEDALAPGDTWRVTVRRDVRILYRIEIKTTAWLGPQRLSPPHRGH
jgi:hypothetical protein